MAYLANDGYFYNILPRVSDAAWIIYFFLDS